MTFYLSPPHGEIPLHRLLALAQTRWSFLIQLMGLLGDGSNEDELNEFLSSRSTIEDSECLIEGNVKDRISHFILRLSCVSKDEMKDLFVEAESALFALRVKSMALTDLLQMSHDLHRQTAKLKKETKSRNGLPEQKMLQESGDVLHNVSQQLRSQLKRLSLDTGHCGVIKVPFQFILPMVANRSVTLVGGIGRVPIVDINILLEILFRQHLTLTMDELKQTVDSCEELFEIDSRIGDIHREMKVVFLANKKQQTPISHGSARRLLYTEVDDESKYFPPCMRFLHERLRLNHRLKHLSRIQYSLFLKEVGLPINEALEFWQREYSQPPDHWKLNQKRYHYNIRHLYGLEGSRRTYTTHSCQHIQNRVLGPLEEAGCPFKHFDQATLHDYLGNAGVTDSERRTILLLANDSPPSHACQHYLESLVASSVSGLSGSSSQSSSSSDTIFPCASSVSPSEVSTILSTSNSDTVEVLPEREVGRRWKQAFSRPSEFYFACRRDIDEATI